MSDVSFLMFNVRYLGNYTNCQFNKDSRSETDNDCALCIMHDASSQIFFTMKSLILAQDER